MAHSRTQWPTSPSNRICNNNINTQMPTFSKIAGALAKEMGTNEAAMHAAILAVNQAIDNEEPADDIVKLMMVGALGVCLAVLARTRLIAHCRSHSGVVWTGATHDTDIYHPE